MLRMALQRDMDASRRFVQTTLRQYDLTSEASVSLASSDNDEDIATRWKAVKAHGRSAPASAMGSSRWYESGDSDGAPPATTAPIASKPRSSSQLPRTRAQPLMLVSSVLACPSTRAVMALDDLMSSSDGGDDGSCIADADLSNQSPTSTYSSYTTIRNKDDDEEAKVHSSDPGITSTNRQTRASQGLLQESSVSSDEEDIVAKYVQPSNGMQLWHYKT